MLEVSTSILTVEKDAVKCFYELEVAGTDYFHIDVMDGRFVENNTTDKMLEYATALSHITTIGMDVHLMCQDIEKYVDEYLMLEPDSITFHIEAVKNHEQAMNIIQDIKSNNVKVGIAVKPNTNIEEIYEYLPFIHKILIMTVEPGKGGQKFIDEMKEKIIKLRKYLDENSLETIIEADGGINIENSKQLKEIGLDIAVVGSYIINSENKKLAISNIKNKGEEI